MENSGKQNPKMGFKSPPSIHSTHKWIKFKHLRHNSFYVKSICLAPDLFLLVVVLVLECWLDLLAG